MFEQEKHDQGTPSQNLPEPQLFKNYEMRSWNLSSRIYKIFGISLVINIVAIFVLGQSNLLTVKGCDSPLIGGVCQVLDTVYVGSKLFGTDSEYIDADYQPTEIGPDDEITYIEVREEPLYYPADYWEIANANDPQSTEIAGIPGITDGPIAPSNPTFPSIGGGLENKPPVFPTPNNNVVNEADLPKPDEDDNDPPVTRNGGKRPPLGGRPGKSTPDGNKIAGIPDPKPSPVKAPPLPSADALTQVVINRRPLDDLGVEVKKLLAANQVDLLAKVDVRAKGKLDESGKIDITTFDYKAATGSDQAMAALIREAILKLSDSGYMNYLGVATIKDLNMSIVQDDANFTATVQSEVETATRAKTLKILLEGAIKYYKDKKSVPEADDNDRDDLKLLNNASVEIDGKKLIIKFVLAKPDAQALIKNKLLIPPPTPQALKPQSAQNQDVGTNTGK